METTTFNTAAPSVDVPRLVRPLRTDEEIVMQTDKLAFTLALLSGYAFDADYKFHLHTRIASCPMPRQAQFWEMARQAQLLLTDTDPDDAVDNLDWANSVIPKPEK
jgi:hypothetical protein